MFFSHVTVVASFEVTAIAYSMLDSRAAPATSHDIDGAPPTAEELCDPPMVPFHRCASLGDTPKRAWANVSIADAFLVPREPRRLIALVPPLAISADHVPPESYDSR